MQYLRYQKALRQTFQTASKVVLIDGLQLTNYAIDFNLGVSVVSEYQIKRLDLDYFEG